MLALKPFVGVGIVLVYVMNSKPLSLNKRMVFSSTMILIFFLSLTALAINKAFKSSIESALKETLNSQLYALMASTEADIVNGTLALTLPSNDLESLLGLPKSGLYARIISQTSVPIWQSESTLSSDLPNAQFLTSGQQRFTKIAHSKEEYYQFSLGVNWIIDDLENPMTFVITQDLRAFNRQLYAFHNILWLWLGGTALFLILGQVFVLKWGLAPIKQLVGELKDIELGHQTQIESTYPKEIEFLSQSINQLLANENSQKKRYRNALGDLTHSLKTPLAVLQSSIKVDDPLNEQILRMNSIVEYQLQKAATAGAHNLAKAIDIKALIERISVSLQKVYVDKNLSIESHYSALTSFKADEGDMMELFGNVLDNAFKWANNKIQLTLLIEKNTLAFTLIDDGAGFPKDLIEQLKTRGQRADQTTPGHGIGLSIVSNIIASYSGHLDIYNSPSAQGATIKIHLK